MSALLGRRLPSGPDWSSKKVFLDGRELDLTGLQGVCLLNIKSFGGGVDFWGKQKPGNAPRRTALTRAYTRMRVWQGRPGQLALFLVDFFRICLSKRSHTVSW